MGVFLLCSALNVLVKRFFMDFALASLLFTISEKHPSLRCFLTIFSFLPLQIASALSCPLVVLLYVPRILECGVSNLLKLRYHYSIFSVAPWVGSLQKVSPRPLYFFSRHGTAKIEMSSCFTPSRMSMFPAFLRDCYVYNTVQPLFFIFPSPLLYHCSTRFPTNVMLSLCTVLH